MTDMWDWFMGCLFAVAVGAFVYGILQICQPQVVTRTVYHVVPAKCEPRIVTETKVVKIPVVEKVIDHRVPASMKRELRALRHRVWVDKQNLATAYLPR